MSKTDPAPETELLICVKCRAQGQAPSVDGTRPGRRLFDSLARTAMPRGVTLRAVECLQNCDHGCTAALRGGNRWTYVYGNLDDTSGTDALIDGAARYHATQDGLIPWRERPEHFKRNCVARIPPLDFTDPLAET